MKIFECLSFVVLFGPMPAIFPFLTVCSLNWNLKEVNDECSFHIKRHTDSQIFPVFAPPLPMAMAHKGNLPPTIPLGMWKRYNKGPSKKAQKKQKWVCKQLIRYTSQLVF